MVSLSCFYSFNGFVFYDFKKKSPIFTYSESSINELLNLTIESIDDIYTFKNQLDTFLEEQRTFEFVPLYEKKIESISMYSFTPKNMLVGEKKDHYEYIVSMKDLFTMLQEHYKSLPELFQVNDFSNHLLVIKKTTLSELKRLEALKEKNTFEIEKKSKKIDQVKKEQEIKREKLEKIVFNLDKNSTTLSKKEKKLSKKESRLSSIDFKKKLKEQQIKETETELDALENRNSSIYVSWTLIFLTLGIILYTKINSKKYQMNKLIAQKYKLIVKIEKLNTLTLSIKNEIKQLKESISELEKLTSNDIRKDLEEQIEVLKEENREEKTSLDLLEEDLVNIDDSLQTLTSLDSEVIKGEIQSILNKINEEKKNALKYKTIFTSSRSNALGFQDEDLKDGFYCTEK